MFPTDTTRGAGNGASQTGPAGAVTYRSVPGLLLVDCFNRGPLLRTPLRIANPVTRLTFQTFFNYQLDQGWYLRIKDTMPIFNLRHNTSTEIR
jgi:hypothetical protein